MKVTLWGTRGSLASPGPDTARYGGNTACVAVQADDGRLLVLDAGTGIRRLSAALARDVTRVDILLTHLHMDHIQGLGFFAPLRDPEAEVHIWGPRADVSLGERLARYLSPPLFPVALGDLACRLVLHELSGESFTIGACVVEAAFVCHPDPTLGYRIANAGTVLCYLPDHEPALSEEDPARAAWTSGAALAAGADLLIHDAQYSEAEYAERVGWGHSSVGHAFAFAARAGVRHLVPFHHDPTHSDDDLDGLLQATVAAARPRFRVTPGREGTTFTLSRPPHAERA